MWAFWMSRSKIMTSVSYTRFSCAHLLFFHKWQLESNDLLFYSLSKNYLLEWPFTIKLQDVDTWKGRRLLPGCSACVCHCIFNKKLPIGCVVLIVLNILLVCSSNCSVISHFWDSAFYSNTIGFEVFFQMYSIVVFFVFLFVFNRVLWSLSLLKLNSIVSLWEPPGWEVCSIYPLGCHSAYSPDPMSGGGSAHCGEFTLVYPGHAAASSCGWGL